MSTQHTPGPWHAVTFDDGSARVIIREADIPGREESDADDTIADVLPGLDAPANARLIAAAPDLLAACREALNHTGYQRGRDLLEAAVARAEGSL